HRPADLLKPEWDELRTQALALQGCDGSDEDVLTYAMFPQVAPKFFSTRAEGPKNVSKKAAPADAAPTGGNGATGKTPISGKVVYKVTLGEKSHQVTVEPA